MGAGASVIDAEELTEALEQDFARVVPRTPRGSLWLCCSKKAANLGLSHNLTHRLATRPPIKEEAHSASRASNAHDDGETVEDGGGRKVWSLDYAASQSRDRVIKAPQGSRPNAVLSNIPKKNGRGRIPR